MTEKTHLLLAVSGMTPQIITETLYGIYRKDKEKLPTRIEVITTQGGFVRLTNNLLGEDSPLQQLIADYDLPPITFTKHDIKVPRGDDGQLLDDVRTEREQEIITDFITNRVRELSKDPNLAIHASLAGGRKTMGFALGYAMSLFGRPQDCLSHVLVNHPYDSVPDFYYPTPKTVWRGDYQKAGQHDLSKAEVTLATIQLVLMREEMPNALIETENVTYTQTVDRINRANAITEETAEIELDFDKLAIRCNGEEILLQPIHFTFYSWMAQDSKAYPGEGIDPPSEQMTIAELDRRMYDFLKSSLKPCTELPESLEDLYELALDNIDRVLDRLNQKGKSKKRLSRLFTDDVYINNADKRDQADLYKKHKNLWDKLRKETNDSIHKIFGKRLASFYEIKTVNKSQIGKSRFYLEYKGLKIDSKNILIDNEKIKIIENEND